MIVWTLIVIVILILVNALYVAAEFAIVSVRATRVEQQAETGHRLARALLPILRDTARLDRYIAACQIGITVSSLVMGAFGQASIGLALGALLIERAGFEPLGGYSLAATLTLIALTSIQVIFGELIPKTLALQYPLATALLTYLPLRWSLTVFAPFISLFNGSGNLILRGFGTPLEASHRHIHAPDEIDLLIRESRAGGLLAGRESERLRETLHLSQHRVRQIMVPRRQIVGLDLRETIERQWRRIAHSPYTRLVVHRGGFDDILGYLHVKDFAAALAAGREPDDLTPLIRPLLALPSSLTIDRALGQLRAQRARIAFLVDEYGDLVGLISLEDIIRELLGELSDEFKRTGEAAPHPLPDGRWRLPGRLPLSEALDWSRALGTPAWEPSAAETLAGWLLERLDAIPEGRCCLREAGLLFEIEELDGVAIRSVLAETRDGSSPGMAGAGDHA